MRHHYPRQITEVKQFKFVAIEIGKNHGLAVTGSRHFFFFFLSSHFFFKVKGRFFPLKYRMLEM